VAATTFAFAERWVRTVASTAAITNEHRPHRVLELLPPDGGDPAPLNTATYLHRRDLLGGLIYEYEAA
jgi:hypothetical protein